MSRAAIGVSPEEIGEKYRFSVKCTLLSRSVNKRKTRLMLCSSSMDGGGSEKQLLYLLQGLDRNRFDIRLYLLYRKGSLLPDVPDDVPIEAYWSDRPIPRWNWPGRIHRDQVRHLASKLMQWDIDIVYDRLFHMTLVTGPATRSASVARVSAIVSPPEHDLVQNEKRWIGWKKSSLRRAYTDSNALLTVGRGVAESAARYYQIPAERFRAIPSPVDIERIDSLARPTWVGIPLRSHRKNIVAVGRLSEEKGHSFLLHAAALYARDAAQDRVPPIDVHLVGDGVLRKELQSLSEKLGLSDSVFFHGHVTNPFSLMSRCDLMVLPSLYEGMPNVLLEAMVCRIPILATDTEQGGGELLREFPLGTLVPKGNVGEMAAAIKDRFLEPSRWIQRLDVAREHVVRHHSLRHWIEVMSQIFESIHSTSAKRM